MWRVCRVDRYYNKTLHLEAKAKIKERFGACVIHFRSCFAYSLILIERTLKICFTTAAEYWLPRGQTRLARQLFHALLRSRDSRGSSLYKYFYRCGSAATFHRFDRSYWRLHSSTRIRKAYVRLGNRETCTRKTDREDGKLGRSIDKRVKRTQATRTNGWRFLSKVVY